MNRCFPLILTEKLMTRMGLDHCLDYLRQSLQCFGDLNPIAFNWNAATNDIAADFDGVLTCRNFDSCHDWASQRATHYQDYHHSHRQESKAIIADSRTEMASKLRLEGWKCAALGSIRWLFGGYW